MGQVVTVTAAMRSMRDGSRRRRRRFAVGVTLASVTGSATLIPRRTPTAGPSVPDDVNRRRLDADHRRQPRLTLYLGTGVHQPPASMQTSPFDLDDDHTYQAWRERKLATAPRSLDELIVDIEDPRRLSADEHRAVLDRCRRANMAIYRSQIGALEGTDIVRACGRQFGLDRLDHNRGAEADAVTALTVQDDALHTPYVPYTDRPIHWHTDGYYNRLDRQDHALLLHCVRPAMRGGANALMDHEMAYLLMRDTNPEFVRALMRPDAMMIPRNVVDGEELRPDRTGPVFMVTAAGTLHMRYTMRKRNVVWEQDPVLLAAVAWLEALLKGGSPHIFRATLQSGWGLISNNVLHDRTGFDDAPDPASKRLLYRARYHDRIDGT